MVCAHFDLAVAHATTLYRRAVFAWANELVALILAIIIIIPITAHLIIISFHLVIIGKVIHARPITGPAAISGENIMRGAIPATAYRATIRTATAAAGRILAPTHRNVVLWVVGFGVGARPRLEFGAALDLVEVFVVHLPTIYSKKC